MRQHREIDIRILYSGPDKRVVAGNASLIPVRHALGEFRLLVSAIVDERFMQCAETRTRSGAGIFETESLVVGYFE